MTENFLQLLENEFPHQSLRPGSLVRARVISIEKDYVVVDARLKSEGHIPIKQFYNENHELEIAVNDEVDVMLESLEDGFGETRLSREKAKRAEAWNELQKAYESGSVIKGFVSGKVKGGFTIDLGSILHGFLPGSLVDVRPVRDTSFIEGKDLEFKVIKLDPKRNNIVLSRRAVLELEGQAERETLLSNLQENQIVKGVIKNLTDYGAFVDLGGIDGLLHITDISWKRINHPSEILNIGDEYELIVLKIDRERGRVSLGLKQLATDPWLDIVKRLPVNTRVKGKITNITDYGCFVEIAEGIEGLVHVSEMDWANKNVNPNKVVQVGMEVEIVVLDVHIERRRISLGIKQCQPNPWEAFGKKYKKGDCIVGKIRSTTDFGLFVGLEGGIDGLVHLSDIAWNVPGEEAIRQYKKGDEVKAVVLSIDSERERISLSIKELEEDIGTHFFKKYPKDSWIKVRVSALEDQGIIMDLGDGIEGYLKVEELPSQIKLNDFNVNDEIEVRVLSFDSKNQLIDLSLKKQEMTSEKTVV